MNLLLVRDAKQPAAYCTLGILSVAGKQFYSMEKPWIENPNGPGGHPQTSCVPVGTYHLAPRYTDKKGHHWILSNSVLGVYEENIPAGQQYGRTEVLIHSANYAHELLGCIAPGRGHGTDADNGEWMVSASRAAMDDLRALLMNESNLTLTIQNGST